MKKVSNGRVLIAVKKKLKLLLLILKHKFTTILIIIVVFLTVVISCVKIVVGKFIPKTDDNLYVVMGDIASGFTVDKVNLITQRVENILKDEKYCEDIEVLVNNDERKGLDTLEVRIRKNYIELIKQNGILEKKIAELEVAQQNYNLQKKKYNEGIISITDYLIYETQLNNNKLSLISTRLDYYYAYEKYLEDLI